MKSLTLLKLWLTATLRKDFVCQRPLWHRFYVKNFLNYKFNIEYCNVVHLSGSQAYYHITKLLIQALCCEVAFSVLVNCTGRSYRSK